MTLGSYQSTRSEVICNLKATPRHTYLNKKCSQALLLQIFNKGRRNG